MGCTIQVTICALLRLFCELLILDVDEIEPGIAPSPTVTGLFRVVLKEGSEHRDHSAGKLEQGVRRTIAITFDGFGLKLQFRGFIDPLPTLLGVTWLQRLNFFCR